MSFTLDLQKYANKIDASLKEAKQAVVFNLFAEVIKKTPVDTGRAKGNYFVTTGAQSASVTDKTNKSPLGTEGSSPELLKVSYDFGVDYITNNLPYIKKLEYGSSKQAPAGMFRITVRSFQEIAKREGWV